MFAESRSPELILRCGHLLQLRKPGRLPDTALPTLQNGVAVTDLAWDPFDPQRLAVGKEADAGGIRVPGKGGPYVTGVWFGVTLVLALL